MDNNKLIGFALGAAVLGGTVLLLTSARSEQEPEPDKGNLLVTVEDVLGLSVQSASVGLLQDGLVKYAMTTDGNGQCQFTNLPIGTYQIIVALGMSSVEQDKTIVAGINETFVLFNPEPEPPAELTFSALQASVYAPESGTVWRYPKVNFTVTNNSSIPILGRTLHLYRRYISQSSGSERVSSVPLSSPLTWDSVPQSSSYPSIDLQPGQSLSIEFVGSANLQRDVNNDIWVEDDIIKNITNVVTIRI